MKSPLPTVNLKRLTTRLDGGTKQAWISCYRHVASFVVRPVVKFVFVRRANPNCHGQEYRVANVVCPWAPAGMMSAEHAFRTRHRLPVPFARCITNFLLTGWYSCSSSSGSMLPAGF